MHAIDSKCSSAGRRHTRPILALLLFGAALAACAPWAAKNSGTMIRAGELEDNEPAELTADLENLRLAYWTANAFKQNYGTHPPANSFPLAPQSVTEWLTYNQTWAANKIPLVGYYPPDVPLHLAQYYPELQDANMILHADGEPLLYLLSTGATSGLFAAKGPDGVWNIDVLAVDWNEEGCVMLPPVDTLYDPSNGALSSGDLILHPDYMRWIARPAVLK